jgi:hypothetical protein
VSLWTLDCHKPVIPVVTFLTPLPWHSQVAKDRWAPISGSFPLLKDSIKGAFTLVFYGRFLSHLSSP